MKGNYGQSLNGHFKVIDTIGVPHPYCITDKHVVYAADNRGGMLTEEAIESSEKCGARCGIKGCTLSFKQHEHALLVECEKELQIEGKTNQELHDYLMSIKHECEKNGYVGFAFKRK